MKSSSTPKLLLISFKTILPALVGLMLLATQSGIQNVSQAPPFQESMSGMSNERLISTSSIPAENEPNWLVGIGEAILASYENYFAFMLMMLLVNMVAHASGILRHIWTKTRGNQKGSIFSHDDSMRTLETRAIFISWLRSIIIYSFMFGLYQIMWIYVAGLFYGGISLPALSEISPVNKMGIRVLEEQSTQLFQDNNYGNNLRSSQNKPSLSIGQELSKMNFKTDSIKLSKDGKTAFVAASSPLALKIIDVSDPEYPITLSSLNLVQKLSFNIFMVLALSPDEKKVYISNFNYLQIIDVSNLKSPVVLTTFQDKHFREETRWMRIPEMCIPNLLVSKDNRFLFEAAYGLKIIDISNLTAPKVVYSEVSNVESGSFIPSSVSLSSDEKHLYYSNGSLSVYNIEDPREIKMISSLNTTFLITSMMLSKDSKTCFVLGSNKQGKILLQKFDTSSGISPIIEQGQIMTLNRTSRYYPVFMSQTPNDVFLMIGYNDIETRSAYSTLAFDTEEEQIVAHKKLFINEAHCVQFAEDYRKVLIGTESILRIVELYLGFPNRNALSESSSQIQSYDTGIKFSRLVLAPSNESLLYSFYPGESKSSSRFGIHAISRNGDMINISSYETGYLMKQMVISQDSKRAFWVSTNTITIVDISNPEDINVIGEYTEKDLIDTLLLSRDGKTGFITHTCLTEGYLKIVDFSDPKNVIKKDSIKISSEEEKGLCPVLSKDEQTIFVLSSVLSIYNVSDHSSITFLGNYTSLDEDFTRAGNPAPTLSPDQKTLVLRDTSRWNNLVVQMIDVSNITSPQSLTELSFKYGYDGTNYKGNSFAFSADSRIFYFVRDSNLAVVDITNAASPRYIGAIKFEKDNTDVVTDFKLSEDCKKAYFFTKNGKFYVTSLQPAYSTYLKQDVFMLGERHSLDLQVIKMDQDLLNYNVMDARYRFAKFALVESRSQNSNFEEISYKAAPSWMSFDLNSQTFNIEPRRKSDIGFYKIYIAFSTQLRYDAFYHIEGLNNYTASTDLLACLVGQGYLDSEFYITQNFGKENDFILPFSYGWCLRRVYETLRKYYFETYNQVEIVQSLNLTRIGDTFKISTASLTNLKVEINLEGSKEAKFLTRFHGHLLPTIAKGKSHLAMEGSVKDINYALEEVVINMHDNVTFCDGEIIIDDKLNPVMTESVKNISRYFNRNTPPGLNQDFSMTLQSQVDHESVYTGQSFQIKLNQKTFFDNFTEVEKLNYQLVYVVNGNETGILPTWISFDDMTLMGTAPEAVFDRDFDFKLVVKNEFQEYKEPVKLSVKISSSFVLKLVIKYSPYILSIVGLMISANKIFNIVFKRSYRHPKDFDVRIGEEITDEVIFPISFIQEEKQEAKTILKFLRKKMGDKENMVSRFILQGEERKLDKLKILETIKETLHELSFEEKKELDFYLGGQNPRISLVDQIIFNTLVTEMLKSEEGETRIYYEKIKKEWVKFVDWDSTNSSFKIHNEKSLLQDESSAENATSSTGLINKSNINVELLKDAILAYAFECQNIDEMPVFIQFKVKEKIKANFLKRFLKLDLQDCPFSEKGKIGYGIVYDREFNTLCFSGTARRDIQGKTLVFQITDLRQRILKEIWIFGKGENMNELGGSTGNEYQIL